MEFPTIVYKDKGQHQRKGGTYSITGADTQEEFDKLIADGWSATLIEAIEPKIDETSAPTRAELEIKADELGIDFDGRTTDRKLLEKIEAKLAEG